MRGGQERHRARMARLLSALHDGDLGWPRGALLRRHLSRCPGCRQTLAELEQQVRDFSALRTPAGTEVNEGDWLALRAKLGPLPARPPARARRLWVPLSLCAAAAAVLLLTVKLQPERLLAPAPSDDVLISLAEQEFRRAEQPYAQALERLRSVSAAAPARFAPARRRAYEQRSAELQQATERSRRLARSRPADAEAQERLYGAYRQQIEYLQGALLWDAEARADVAPGSGPRP